MGSDKMNGERVYASLGLRIPAALIDLILFCVIFFPTTYLVKGVWILSPIDHRWAYGLFITDPLCLAFLVIMALYFILLEAYAGATIGKFIVGIRVIPKDEDPSASSKPGLRRSIIRNLLRVVDSLPTLFILGMILISKSSERARFGDEKAGTRVIKRQSS